MIQTLTVKEIRHVLIGIIGSDGEMFPDFSKVGEWSGKVDQVIEFLSKLSINQLNKLLHDNPE